jgi:hypothetical protein
MVQLWFVRGTRSECHRKHSLRGADRSRSRALTELRDGAARRHCKHPWVFPGASRRALGMHNADCGGASSRSTQQVRCASFPKARIKQTVIFRYNGRLCPDAAGIVVFGPDRPAVERRAGTFAAEQRAPRKRVTACSRFDVL